MTEMSQRKNKPSSWHCCNDNKPQSADTPLSELASTSRPKLIFFVNDLARMKKAHVRTTTFLLHFSVDGKAK